MIDNNYAFNLFDFEDTKPVAENKKINIEKIAADPKPKAKKQVSKSKTQPVVIDTELISQTDALELARENYKEYSIYIAQGRAYPCILDGAKSVQKRVLYSLATKAPRSIVKVAEASGYCLDLHPHPSAVPEVIVSFGDTGNKFNFLDKQGNFGNKSRGIEASAPRYIGCKLSDLAMLLTCDSIEYCPTLLGELDKPEPEALPTLIPLCFINGQSGIPSGLPKLNIPCLDIPGMFNYYIDILKHKDLNYVPKKFPIPNLGVNILSTKTEWEDILKSGKGGIRLAPKMEIDKKGIITITALPASKSVEHVRKIIEKEILQDKVDLRDESTYDTRVVIEKVPKKQCNMREIYDRLYKKLQTTDSYNMAFFDQNHIYVPCGFDKVVKANLQYLISTHENRLTHQIKDNEDKLEVLQIIEKLKKSDHWKDIFDLSFEAAIKYLETKFKCSEEIAQNVFKKPISYLTKAHQKEIDDLIKLIDSLKADKSDIYEMLLKKYQSVKLKMNKEIKENQTKFI